jgi:hypothetical protein
MTKRRQTTRGEAYKLLIEALKRLLSEQINLPTYNAAREGVERLSEMEE